MIEIILWRQRKGSYYSKWKMCLIPRETILGGSLTPTTVHTLGEREHRVKTSYRMLRLTPGPLANF